MEIPWAPPCSTPLFHAHLAAVVPAGSLLTAAEDTRPYECDGLTLYRELPAAVVLPETEAQVVGDPATLPRRARAGRRARRRHRPVGRRAAARATAWCCRSPSSSASCAIDPIARTAVVQPGVRNLAISRGRRAARPLLRARSRRRQIACTIGGNVAENSGGVHCLKYGLTVHNVLRVRGVTIDGDVDRARRRGARRAGLRPARAGHRHARACSRVITEVTVKLLPKPQLAQVHHGRVRRRREAPATRSRAIIAAGIIPAGLEMMDQPATRAVEQFVHAGYPTSTPRRSCSCESDGTRRRGRGRDRAHDRACCASAARRAIRVSRDEAERLRFWSGRKAAFPGGRAASRPTTTAWTAPSRASALARDAAARSTRWTKKYGLRCANVFHAGDGNLHPLILFDANEPGELERAERVRRRHPRAVRRGGRHHHRRARRRRREDQRRCACSSRAAELDALPRGQARLRSRTGCSTRARRSRRSHRCAEFGRMHVHRGQLRHPELPRF